MVVKFRLICFLVLFARFSKKKNNVLRLLLTLECVVLFLFIILCFLNELYFRVIFLRVGACEAAVGLGCLVGLIRLAGQNFVTLLEYGSKLYPKVSLLKRSYNRYKIRLFHSLYGPIKFLSCF